MKYLVTGGCGFLGSNLASRALHDGDDVVVFDNLSRVGSQSNLDWLRGLGPVQFVDGDIRNADDVTRCVKESRPDVIFHLAGQVAMTTSMLRPRMDFEINALGTLNVLEAARDFAHDAPILYSSTNKVYGDMNYVSYVEGEMRYTCPAYPDGFDESLPLDFQSPYGCSKGAGDQYILDYGRSFGLKTVVFRHSSIYGARQFSTFDQGWVGWFCAKAAEARKAKKGKSSDAFVISGDGKQVRDVLYSDDLIGLYFSAVKNISRAKGNAFNIGGGMKNSLSLRELFKLLEEYADCEMNYTESPWREHDQKVFVADIAKAKELIGWEPRVGVEEGIKKMLGWVMDGSANDG